MSLDTNSSNISLFFEEETTLLSLSGLLGSFTVDLNNREMLTLGSLGNGGSTSSSSNLSALAPPFTVNRSNPKPNSNPLVHFTDSPYAAPPFNQNTWVYPHSSATRPDYCSNIDPKVDSIRTTSVPLPDDYQITDWSALDPTAKTVTNAFSYPVEAEPYYPPYVSSINASPLVSLSEPSYDLLSTSGFACVDVSLQIDYTQNLAPFEYTPQWDGLWNGLENGKQGNPMELDGTFCLEEKNAGGSLLYKNYTKQGGRADEGRSKCGEDFSISWGKCTDVFGTTNTGKLDEKSFFGQNASFIPFESSRSSILGAGSVLTGSHLQAPSLELATNSLNHQKPYNPLEKCRRQPLDSYMNNCVSATRSSPALFIRPPAFGSTTLPLNKVSPKSVNIGNVAALKHEDFDSHHFSKEKEPLLPLNSDGKEGFLGTCPLSFYTEKNDHVCVASSSTKDESSNKPLLKDCRSNARSAFQVSDINVPDGFYITDASEGVKSTENSSDCLDHHAVDSPCWKGASGVHFSPFEVFETPTKQHLTNKIDAHTSLNLQGSQIFPPNNDCAEASSPKLFENSMHNQIEGIDNYLSLSPKKTSDANCLVKEHRSGDAVKAGDNCLKLSGSIGVLSFDVNDKPRKEYDLPYESKSDFNIKACQAKQLLFVEDQEDINCTGLKLEAGVADTVMNTSDVSEDGRVSFHVVENVLSSPSSDEDATEIAKPRWRETAPIMNIQMLVNAMHNFSELLLFHCSNDVCGLKKHDCESLKHVINILDACMSRKIVNVMPPQASLFPQQGTSHKVEELPDLYMGASASLPQVNKADLHGQLGFQHMHEERRNYNVSGKKVEKSPDFVSLKDDAEASKDKMVQAIKKLLNENLNDEEEGQSQTLLYKNLWLEAEAKLCSVGYKARFDRMKAWMEKRKANKAKENITVVQEVSGSKISPDSKMISKANKANENISVVQEVSVSEISPDPMITSALTPGVKESLPLKNSMQDFRSSCTTNHVDDVEASVMTRFHILKCRNDNSNSINMTQGQLPELVDTGFAGNRSSWPFTEYQSEDGCLKAAVGPHLQQHSTRNCNDNKFVSYRDVSEHGIGREFHVCVKDDSVVEPDGSNKLANQHPAGWYDNNSSSDWEHVLKDELAWPK